MSTLVKISSYAYDVCVHVCSCMCVCVSSDIVCIDGGQQLVYNHGE